MNELVFGSTLSPTGELRKIHLIIDRTKKILCKTNHMGVRFEANFIYTIYTVPRNIPFCKGCLKKTKYSNELKQIFFIYNKKHYYISTTKKCEGKVYITSKKPPSPPPMPPPSLPQSEVTETKVECDSCFLPINNSFIKYKNKIFHTGKCFLSPNTSFHDTSESKIYRHIDSKNIMLI